VALQGQVLAVLIKDLVVSHQVGLVDLINQT
jgi:hypothetical protein